VSVAGNLALQFDRVQWGEGRVPALTGNATWAPAQISAPLELALGRAQLDSVADRGVSRGKLQVSGGALLVEADVELDPDGVYRLDAQIQQKDSVPDPVRQFLSTFADYANGRYRLEWSASL
jgi:hypothetical protein